jgi:hypothetical protein
MPVITALRKSALAKFASIAVTQERSADLKIVFSALAPCKSAFGKLAFSNLASVNVVPENLVFVSLAPLKDALSKKARVMSLPERSDLSNTELIKSSPLKEIGRNLVLEKSVSPRSCLQISSSLSMLLNTKAVYLVFPKLSIEYLNAQKMDMLTNIKMSSYNRGGDLN